MTAAREASVGSRGARAVVPAGRAIARETITRPSILLVDDRPDKVLALEAVLSDLPVTVVRAHSGREALRRLLEQEFAVILLDVNMPGMDGFETATLIRQRKTSEHTPIIFITAFHDDMMLVQGYKLGAVDYMPQPVVADVLRTKVQVFVELYRKTRQLAAQAERERYRAGQLEKLAAASVAINAALSMEKMLQLITEAARDVVGAHQAATVYLVDAAHLSEGTVLTTPPVAETITRFSDKYARWRNDAPQFSRCAETKLGQSRVPVRLTEKELRAHADWPLLSSLRLPPMRNLLAAPLLSRDGVQLGMVFLIDRVEGEFTGDDENILLQLTQMGSIAIENAVSYEAREANRAKDHFLAVLSHELRTPLTPALAILQQLAGDRRLAPEVLEDVGIARRNIELEARLIDDLLDLTRIAKGKIELRLDDVDAHALLQETINICRPEIAAKQLRLSVELKAEHFAIRADVTRLQQVYWNLLKNAVKFTPAGGQIVVSSRNVEAAAAGPENGAAASGAGLVIDVRDTGIGIEPEVLPRLFTAFEQGRRAITRQFGGLGLGLTISKALVDLHGGQLSAISDGRGKGAIFSLSLPVNAAAGDKRSFHLPRLTQPSSQHALRILLVEDHPDTARIMAKLLGGMHHRVRTAGTVAAALEACTGEGEHFDLIISDIGLPDGSGLDLMRQLRASGKAVPQAIAISGFGMEEDIRRSTEAGFAAHLTKPLNLGLLADTIDRMSALLPQEAGIAG